MSKKEGFLKLILKEISNNSNITESKIAILIDRDERTVRRYFKLLKDLGIIKLEKTGKDRKWIILKK